MKSFIEYQQNLESLNESELFINHGKDINSVLKKMSIYHNNIRNRRVNESSYNITFTLNEQQASKDLLKFCLLDYQNALLTEEQQLMEQLSELGIDEGFVSDWIKKGKETVSKGFDKGKELIAKGKEKLLKAVEEVKIKIAEVKKLFVAIAKGAIDTIKKMVEMLMGILEKLSCKIADIFGKVGFDTEKLGEDWYKTAKDIAKNAPEGIKKYAIYEAYGNSLRNKEEFINEEYKLMNESLIVFINEDDDLGEEEKSKGKTMEQTEKKGWKSMIWNAFKQLAIWATVCVVIPGLVIGFFPGTFIALLVPLACKLAWNAYSIVKLWKQFKKVKQEWGTYKKWQKCFTVCTMVLSIIGILFNFKSLFDNLGPVVEGFMKSGGDLFAQAKLGIEPDALQKGFGAIVKMLKERKFSFDDFGQAYKEITDSFAKEIEITKYVKKVVTKAGDAASEQDVQDIMNTTKGSTKIWNKLRNICQDPSTIDNMSDDTVVRVVIDGVKEGPTGKALASELGNIGDHLSKATHTLSNGAGGTVFTADITVGTLKKLMKGGLHLSKHVNFGTMQGVGILGEVTSTVTQIVPEISTVLSTVATMAVTIPTINVAPENNGGFRVRLGKAGDKDKFVYEVGKDGVKLEKFDDIKDDISKTNKESLEELNERYKEVNSQFEKSIKALEDDKDLDEDKKKKSLESIKKLKEEFDEKMENQELIVFYGKKVKEESKNESIVSLLDYMIVEGVTNNDLKDSLNKISNYIVGSRGNIKQDLRDGWRKYLKGEKDLSEQAVKNIVALISNEYNKQGDAIEKDKDENKDLGVNKKLNLTKEEAISLLTYCNTLGKNLNNAKEYKDDLSDEEKNEIKEQRKKNFEIYKIIYGYLNKDEKFKDDLFKKKIDIIKIKDPKKPSEENTENGVKHSGIKPEEIPTNIIPAEEPEDDPTPETTGDDDNDKEVPVLYLSPLFMYAGDIAESDKKGPRKELYTMKGIYGSLEFIEIKGGTSISNLEKFLSKEIMGKGLFDTYKIICDKPAKTKDGKKYELNKYSVWKENERTDYGTFTNKELTDLLNNPDSMQSYLKSKGGKTSTAETEEEKKKLKELQEKDKNAIKNNDEIKEKIKNSKTLNKNGIIDDDGNVDDDKLDDLTKSLSEYQMGTHKSKKNKGFWGSIKSFLGFGDDEDSYDEDEMKELNSLIASDVKESLTNYIYNPIFTYHRSLKDYINSKK